MDEEGQYGDETLANPNELWQREADPNGEHSTWYRKAVEYWDGQEASYNGVLGGYGHVSDTDVHDSRTLLEKAFRQPLEEARKGKRSLVALDCGAGVGRVTKELLLHYFKEVDLLEPSQHLLGAAEKDLKGPKAARLQVPSGHHAVNFYCSGLQAHDFMPGRYDCIWIQWCLLYLTDEDVIQLFDKCRGALRPGGIIFVKENICQKGFIVDKSDSSVTRSNAYMLDLFERAGMQVAYNVKQRNFPKHLFEVRMYVLKHKAAGAAAAATAATAATAMDNS